MVLIGIGVGTAMHKVVGVQFGTPLPLPQMPLLVPILFPAMKALVLFVLKASCSSLHLAQIFSRWEIFQICLLFLTRMSRSQG